MDNAVAFTMTNLLSHLSFLYGSERAPQLFDRVQKIMAGHRPRIPKKEGGLTESDSILITYGDQGQTHDEQTFQNLKTFFNQFFTDVVNGIHIMPLLTTFKTLSGEKQVWTTFSSDQIDLNYQNPEVLLEILDILLMYVEYGAMFIRLDAIAYLWKEIGTTCIHLPQTHHVIQFLRAALNEIAPHVHLITETNVPHLDNISYFGDGTDEAQLVYNFALPPLILHTFRTENAGALSNWAKTLSLPSERVTFFNFLASHDGVGLNPVRGLLVRDDIDALVKNTLEHGGFVSYKQNSDVV